MASLDPLRKFERNASGAALVEYSLLTGLLTAAVAVIVVLLAGWAITRWENLQAALGL